MIDEATWRDTKNQCPVGAIVEGQVTRVEPYGVFVRFDHCSGVGLLSVTEFEDGDRSFDLSDYPNEGSRIRLSVRWHSRLSR